MPTTTVTYNGSTIVNQDMTAPVAVTYGGSTIVSVAAGQSKTLGCSGKYMSSNVVVGSKTLNCKDKIMASNVVVSVASAAPDLVTLLSNAVVLATGGRNSSTTGRPSVSGSSAPASGVCYLFSIYNGYLGIYKITNRAISSTAIKRSSTSYCGYYNYSSGSLYYYHNSIASGSSTSSSTSVYGATMALVQFPDYDASVVDTVLGAMTVTRLAGRYASTTSTVRVATSTAISYDCQLCAKSTYLDFWKTNGSTCTKIVGTATAAGSVSSGYLTLGSVYGGSIIGLTDGT